MTDKNNAEWRIQRIKELRAELEDLLQIDSGMKKDDFNSVREEARRMKNAGTPIQAVKYVREKTGLSLREANDLVMGLV